MVRSVSVRIGADRCSHLYIPISTSVFELRVGLLCGERTMDQWTGCTGLIVGEGGARGHEVVLGDAETFNAEAVGVRVAVARTANS